MKSWPDYNACGPVGHNGDEKPRTGEHLGNGKGYEPGTLAPSPARPGSDDEDEGAEGAAIASQAALNLVEIVRQEKKSVVVVEVPPSEQRTNSQDAQAERAMLGRADAPVFSFSMTSSVGSSLCALDYSEGRPRRSRPDQ